MHAYQKAFFSLVVPLYLSACVTSKEADVKVSKSPSEDRDFDQALEKATRHRTIFKDFETRYVIDVTYLSPEFRSSFAKRLDEIYKRGEIELGQFGQKAGFFVSLHSFDETRTDLSNNQHWSVYLKTNTGNVKPMLIKPLFDKERWRAFFPSVNMWTQDFLVIFDIPSIDTDTPKLVEKNPVTVIFANADAQMELVW